MRPRNSTASLAGRRRWIRLPAAVAALALLVGAILASQEIRRRPKSDDFTISVDVDLVVLHTTVVDRGGRVVTELPVERFRVFENDVEQKLAVFRNEDVPVTVGLVLDNSSSMTDNRREMLAGALTFAESSNPLDEVFVVNFNDDYYLDLEGKDFTNNIEELKEALTRTTTRGSTAFYDAILASLQHLKRGTRQKKVLLIISDGVNNASVSTFDTLLREAQESEAALYLVGLPCTDSKRDCRKAKREIRKLAEVSGGMSYFPVAFEQVEALCKQIAHDVRSQYLLGYYPLNRAKDGTFRRVRVEVTTPKGAERLIARTRPGYFAASATTGSQ